MPKFSANLGFLWPELKLVDRIYAAKRAGFGAVECHWPYDTPAAVVKRALNATSLEMLALNTEAGNIDAGEYGLAAVPGREDDARAAFDKGLAYARTIGSQNIHVMAGTAGDDSDIMSVYLDNLAYAARAADEHDIGIIIEPINRVDRPSYTLDTIAKAIDVAKQLRARGDLGSAAQRVRIMFDCYHVQRTEGDLAMRLEQALPYLVHIQIAAVPGRAEPDQGEINYPWLYSLIDQLGYDGYVGAEYLPATTTDAGLGWYTPWRTSESVSQAATVYRDYTRKQLDREYNNIEKVPDAQAHLGWFAELSATLRQSQVAEFDLSFGDHKAETLDVIYCNDARGGEKRPVHVFFHGGYWRALHKDDFSFVANAFKGTDTICVVVNYALIPDVDMSELVAQCRRSLLWIREHIAEYGGDPDNISISGHSAGGHLVAMMMATDWPRLAHRCPADLVKRGVSLSGVFDLEPIRQCFLNATLGLDGLAVSGNSPMRFSNRNRGDLVCCYGGREGPEFERQSKDLATRWSRTTARSLAIHDHFTIVRELEDPDSEVSGIVRSQ